MFYGNGNAMKVSTAEQKIHRTYTLTKRSSSKVRTVSTVTRTYEDFISSMPVRYSQTFTRAMTEQHARTVWARRHRIVNVGAFKSPGRRGTALTVVAKDRPGLLAMISLAMVTCELDIIEAEVFTRTCSELSATDEQEAVDLFWVRRKPPHDDIPVGAADIRKLRDTLTDFMKRAPSELLPLLENGYYTPASTGTSLRFLEDQEGRFTTLEIETNDRSGLMLSVCQALFGEGIQILGSRIKTITGRVFARFEIAELSERPVELARRHLIKLAILHAVDHLEQGAIARMVG
jgi:UTP:GlnB (protein PII) uridylyltransferase